MLPVHQTWSMCRVLSGSPLMGCQNAGLLGRWGKHASPPWLHTDLLLYQSIWTAADMGDNFLSGCARMHCDLVPNTGLTRRPVFIANCLLQSQRRRIFNIAAAPLDYYAHTQLPRADLSSTRLPSIPRTLFHASISPSSSAQLSTCHRGYQQKWLW